MPFLNPDIPFRPVSSGQAEAVLANGELRLDLSNARLRFPDGRDGGEVHVQFEAVGQFSHAALESVQPRWVYAIQPPEIAVSGTLGVTIEAPAWQGSYAYLPEAPVYVVMLGLDPASQQIVPVGAGLLENHTVTATLTELKRFDYFGYALLPDNQQALEDYANGESSLQALIQALTENF